MPQTIDIQRDGAIATITLRRPEVHNAFNPELIRELHAAFTEVGNDPAARVIVLAGGGKSFCAGADLNWMRAALDYTFEQNVEDALALGRLLLAIYTCPKPVVARVHGAALGGGAGLVAACDLPLALDRAVFAFSEAKLGLVPGMISPFVLRRLAPAVARRLFVTAERFTAAAARGCGLVAEVLGTEAALDEAVARRCAALLENGPQAMVACKRLVEEAAPVDWDAALLGAARRIAAARVSAEGQEGMRAFLEKRPPAWMRQD